MDSSTDEALQAYQASIETISKAIRLQQNPQYFVLLHSAQLAVGDALKRKSDFDRALIVYRDAVKAISDAEQLDPKQELVLGEERSGRMSVIENKRPNRTKSELIEEPVASKKTIEGFRRLDEEIIDSLSTETRDYDRVGSARYADYTYEIQLRIGQILVLLDRYEEAIVAYREGTEVLRKAAMGGGSASQYDKLHRAYQRVGDMMSRQGDFKGARSNYRDAIWAMEHAVDKVQTNAMYHDRLRQAYQDMAKIFEKEQDQESVVAFLKGAITAATDAVRWESDNPAYHINLASVQRNLGQVLSQKGDTEGALLSYQKEVAALKKAINLKPKDGVYLNKLHYAHQHVGELLESKGSVDRALLEFGAAVQALQKAVGLDSDRALYWNNLSVALLEEGRLLEKKDEQAALVAYRDAVNAATSAAKLEPETALYHSNLGTAYGIIAQELSRQENWNDALTAYGAGAAELDQAAKVDRNDPRLFNDLYLSHVRRGEILTKLGHEAREVLSEYRAALVAAKKAVDLSPDEATYQNNLNLGHARAGVTLREMGDSDGALVEFQKALLPAERAAALRPQDSRMQRYVYLAHRYVGDVLLKKRDLEGASKEYRAGLPAMKKAILLEPDNFDYKNDLSSAYLNLGRIQVKLLDQNALEFLHEGLMTVETFATETPQDKTLQLYIAGLLLEIFDLTKLSGTSNPSELAKNKSDAVVYRDQALIILENLEKEGLLPEDWEGEYHYRMSSRSLEE